jgi:hypothetical protein
VVQYGTRAFVVLKAELWIFLEMFVCEI